MSAAGTHTTLSDGVEIVFDTHPGGDDLPLLFVHGGRAHRGWFDHLASLLSGPWAALDLSGHGDSGRRDVYSYDAWSTDIATVAEVYSAEVGSPVVIVAHSLGGMAAFQPRVREDSNVLAVISVDGAPIANFFPPIPTSPNAGFATLEDAVTHFSRARNREDWRAGLVDSVARRSVELVDGRYRWKHDPATVGIPHPESNGVTATPVAILRGELSPFFERIATSTVMDIPGLRLTTVPGVGHDMMMEQPGRFVQVVRATSAALLA